MTLPINEDLNRYKKIEEIVHEYANLNSKVTIQLGITHHDVEFERYSEMINYASGCMANLLIRLNLNPEQLEIIEGGIKRLEEMHSKLLIKNTELNIFLKNKRKNLKR